MGMICWSTLVLVGWLADCRLLVVDDLGIFGASVLVFFFSLFFL
jgi:hypothetical protein